MQLQLLDSVSFFDVFKSSESDVRIIKGFGSTTGIENIDRDGEFVTSPFEFDLATFKNSPQLLLDHDYIKTPEGNQVAAGKVTKAIPAYIAAEDPVDSSYWVVKSLTTDDFVSLWPKSKSPSLSFGSQGLFIVAEVSNPFAINLVDKGELGAFSWRGFATTESNGYVSALKNIDVVEFSIVHTQSERSSTFMLVDQDDPTNKLEVDFTDCELCSLQFSKNVHTLIDVQQYTKKFNLSEYVLSESQDSYLLTNGNVVVEKAFEYCQGNGISVLASPSSKLKTKEFTLSQFPQTNPILENNLMENETSKEAVVPATLLLVDLETFKSKVKNVTIEHSKSTMIADHPAEIYTAIVDEVIDEVAVEDVADEVVVEDVVVDEVVVVDPVVETEVDLSNSINEKLISAIEALSEEVQLLKDESQKQKDEVAKSIADLDKKVTAQHIQKSVDLQTSRINAALAAFGSVVPTEIPRQETQKSVSQAEPKVDNFIDSLFSGKVESN